MLLRCWDCNTEKYVYVARASNAAPCPLDGSLVGGVDNGTNQSPDAVDGASPSQLELAESSAVASDGAAEISVLAESNVVKVDRAAEGSVLAESSVLKQEGGHGGFPVEESLSVGGLCGNRDLPDGLGGGREQGLRLTLSPDELQFFFF